MKIVLALMPLFAHAATDADETSSMNDDATVVSLFAAHEDSAVPPMPDFGEHDEAHCEIVIEQALEQSGMPILRRETATDERPLLSAAVDRRIDGCPVIQMLANPDDVRPFPKPEDGPALRLLATAE
ncbi:hypothetical protein [Pseudoblastomonas halimionae]|uniref:Uncharacterized protein n=1 Tax=Alteriqipengyuania halimionae TaxID=1926630 RepID=A0A6I4U3R1_9SPHN|nr:hypothetical protein [Alteriqipengyuania halimionae]MXP09555.1 hypothetical protein [Alteriqipengyuania halimionae]